MKTILVVDDNALMRQVITSCLAKTGARLKVVTSAEEAVESIRRDGKPDLVLSDVGLPGRSGTDLVRHLRTSPATRTLPVIAVTTLGGGTSAQSLRQSGFSDVIAKPLDPGSFAAHVARWLK